MKDVTKEILQNGQIKAESAAKYIAGDAVIKTVKRRSQQEKLCRAGYEIAQALKHIRRKG